MYEDYKLKIKKESIALLSTICLKNDYELFKYLISL